MALNALQALLWEDGCCKGNLAGRVGGDVASVLMRWHQVHMVCCVNGSRLNVRNMPEPPVFERIAIALPDC